MVDASLTQGPIIGNIAWRLPYKLSVYVRTEEAKD